MSGSVRYLDTQVLLDAANKVKGCVETYKNTVKAIDRETTALIAGWWGEGRKEFDKDYSTIYQQLNDISDIMYDLYDSLVDADSTYVQTDEEIAKGLTMGGA